MSDNTQDKPQDPIHIGNLIEILSSEHGYLVGRVVYRDETMLRVMPQEASDRAIEFPMSADGEFDPTIGVTNIEVIEVQTADHYVDFLGARPGEMVEFFNLEGEEAAPTGTIAEITKTDYEDSITLTDGRSYSFDGVGPQPPIAVIRVRSSQNVAATATATATATGDEESMKTKIRTTDILALLNSVLPSSSFETAPTAERIFPDAMQREDLFQDLLSQLSAKQQTNPRRIRLIEREVDLAIALKNKVIERDAAGRIVGPAPNTMTMIGDAIAAAVDFLPAAIPIVNAARVLNLDMQREEEAYNPDHVLPRTLNDVEAQSETTAKLYEEGALPAGLGKAFAGYAYDLLSRDQATLSGARPVEWQADQDVIRTASLDILVQGLSTDLPASGEQGSPDVSLVFLNDNVTDRTVRVLHADRIKSRKTGEDIIVAPTDPSQITGHIILPSKAALALRPPIRPCHLATALIYSERLQDENLPTMAQTLWDLYAPLESIGPLVAWTIDPETAANLDIAGWITLVLKYAVHPIDSLGPRTPALLSLLDTMGLEARDLDPTVKDVIDNWVTTSQQLWMNLLLAERSRIKVLADAEPDRSFQSVTGEDSPVWKALQDAPALKELIEDIARRNPTIIGSSIVGVAALLTEAQGDATPLVWSILAKLDGRTVDVDDLTAAAALTASRSYILRRKALRDLMLLSLRAEPEINPCPHTRRLEAIRNIGEVVQRSRLLRDFIEEYQGGRKGDWITCTLCSQDCVCYHELMELEALAQPARMDAIQKQMLIRFGGDRYEGKIVCRNCGQALQNIDFDDHVEFDDNGRPIVESSVLPPEEVEVAPITFKSAAQRYLFEILTYIMSEGGFSLPEPTVRMIVQYADLFVIATTPVQAAFEAQRTQRMTSASTRLSIKGGLVAQPEIPTYAAWLDDLRVIGLTGLTVIALQTAIPPIVVNSSSPACRYSGEGWPINPAAAPNDPKGTVAYMACVIAMIARDTLPWKNMKWSGEGKREIRMTKVMAGLVPAMQLMLVGHPKTGPLPFTASLRQLLTQVQSDESAAKERMIVSVRDVLPFGFRPAPFPGKMGRPSVERDPLPNVVAAVAEGKLMRASLLDPLVLALRRQAMAVVTELHEEAAASIAALGEHKPVGLTESVCCPVSLNTALTGEPEQLQLLRAGRLVRGVTGTKLWEQMQEPEIAVIEQTVDNDVYFKLFLKYCFRGPQVGDAHEFSAGNICRQCGLTLGKPIDLVDFAAEGAAILAAQQGGLKVEVTQPAFEALSDAVRRRKIMVARIMTGRPPWESGLEKLAAACVGSFGAIGAALKEILAAGAGAVKVDEGARIARWAPISEIMGLLQSEITTKIGPISAVATGRSKKRSDEARAALKQLVDMTEDPFVESPRALQEYWCAKTEGAGVDYAVRTVKGAKWFKISTEHDARMNKIMRENADWYGGVVTVNMREPLAAIGLRLGPLLRIWVATVRPDVIENGYWTKSEAQMVLQCLVMQVWRDAVTSTSDMYRSVKTPAIRVTVSDSVADWTIALMVHARQQFSRYDAERVKKILQQRAELETTSVVEEFSSIKDDDLRAAELIKKQFRIGRWGLAAKGFRKYDAEMYEFETEQRHRMGIIDPPVDPVLLEGAAAPQVLAVVLEEGYDVDQAADGDNY